MEVFVSLNTVALELVPPNLDRGAGYAVEDAQKVARLATESGVGERLGHVMIPAMIAEDGDRPVEMKPKMDVLDYWQAIQTELPGACLVHAGHVVLRRSGTA